eukprot:CAMPEP_0196757758 /NCGR_PEP_ID=MMETSP1091-20130531/103824_1 /TAXON_ID=302021 /ORGANISM="Rhodomonas sp., Strain CCMP768" /LENGTH=128 /DNA_ID=CAMNT_0042106543 /DNA_START=152 /DNA_END=539 /DNA_ORIENTATION=+
MRNGLKLVKFARGTALGALEDEPWTWKGAWRSDMPSFFSDPEISGGVYDNVFDNLGSLEDEPWTWKGAWRSDMPSFFSAPEISGGVYDNVFDNEYYSLDSDPVPWHITEPVDPTAYQGEYIGQVIGIY